MWQKIKDDFQRRPKTFIVIFIIMGLMALFLLYMLRDSFAGFWPNEARINREKNALIEDQNLLQDEINKAFILIQNQDSFIAHSQNCL